ncbi:pantoate--beta-alanine ligase [Alkalihalophilus lindianensis]|uniref:Pantothenate synthetase n=1 Tax=Alkalihalophilus lindianensis TaxID=1630542 RepID=A0ABU3X6G1_9BACI|nr:pantoate--beta-alanine ligase [Alkalihalophilus lindianensis]MDV2683497.1 pantoate--beta-alanine ligase [Alkalihalophilus lindianensis]
MKIIQEIPALKTEIRSYKQQNQSIGFVPTMGFLHEGHISLLEEARKHHDKVVLSIFVNPLQFGPTEDLDRYPRDFKRDEQIANELGVDLLFYPSVEEMYPTTPSMTIHVTQGVNVLCGASRPGHFDGVTTVVMKLFMLVQPDKAYFGQKDAQQVAVITNMVNMFNVPVEIVPCPTIREEDGLAKSSRNVYLSALERLEAPSIYKTLHEAVLLMDEGETNPSRMIQFVQNKLQELPLAEIDYIELLAYPSLHEVDEIKEAIVLAVALKYKKARLIDNVIVNKGE